VARRRRSLHFVPGGNDRMLAKALTLPADGLILDLEDAVAPDRKAVTRGAVREWLGRNDFGGRERWVRMNPIATGLGQADLEETIAARPDGYVVPKPGCAADIREIVRILDRLEQRHGIPNGAMRLTLIATETPEGLLNIREIATATPRTVAISWGVEDLGAAHLADHDAVRSHAKRVPQEIPLGHRPLGFDVGWPRLEPDHVLLLELQLGRVLDGHDALGVGDRVGEHVQHRGLAGAGAAGDEDVQPGLHGRP